MVLVKANVAGIGRVKTKIDWDQIKLTVICHVQKKGFMANRVVQNRLTVVHMKNNTIINNNTRINCVLCSHNCKPTFASFSILTRLSNRIIGTEVLILKIILCDVQTIF